MTSARAHRPLLCAAALLAALVSGVAGAAEPPASPIAGADANARIATAQEMKKKDALALAKSLRLEDEATSRLQLRLLDPGA